MEYNNQEIIGRSKKITVRPLHFFFILILYAY